MSKLYEKYIDMWEELIDRLEEVSLLSNTINVSKLLDVMDDMACKHLSK